jgi:DNA-directed RNA polymerase subunit RPC12/RpoP
LEETEDVGMYTNNTAEDMNNVNNVNEDEGEGMGVNTDNLSVIGNIHEEVREEIQEEDIHEDIHEGIQEDIHEDIHEEDENRNEQNRNIETTLITSFGFGLDTLGTLDDGSSSGMNGFDNGVDNGIDNHSYESSLRTATAMASWGYREESEVVDVIDSREALLTIHNGYMNEMFLPIPFLNPILMKELFFTRNLKCMESTGECLICRSEDVKLYDVHGESNESRDHSNGIDEKHLVCMKCLLSLISVFDAETEKRTIPCPYCRQNIFFSS